MGRAVLFPFGWIRGVTDENWQILWNPSTKGLYLKGIRSGRIVVYCSADSWRSAKLKSDVLLSDPELLKGMF